MNLNQELKRENETTHSNVDFFLCEVRVKNTSRLWYTNLIRVNTDLLFDQLQRVDFMYLKMLHIYQLLAVLLLITVLIVTQCIETKIIMFSKLTADFINDLSLKTTKT